MDIANSIWFRDNEDRLQVEMDFLKTNADYYGAAAYKSPFDDQTLKDINEWVKTNTDGMIEKVLDEINEAAVMYLINAVVFDAQWKQVYTKENIVEGEFYALDGTATVDFMNSEELVYLENDLATGFLKPYAGDQYSFVALLPNEDVSMEELITSLTGQAFLQLMENQEHVLVRASLPKFSYDYKVIMNDALKQLGMPTAFSASGANFERLGHSSNGNIFIGEVLHKTFIAVDELGTKAGAVTKVEMQDEAYMEGKTVRLDRPFVYVLIDQSTNLPLFIGTLCLFVSESVNGVE